MENSEESQRLKRAKDYLDPAKKHNWRTIVERYFNDEPYQQRMHEQGSTQTEMEEFDLAALERKKRSYS